MNSTDRLGGGGRESSPGVAVVIVLSTAIPNPAWLAKSVETVLCIYVE